MRTSKPKLKVWLRDPLPVPITIKGITYIIQQDVVQGGPGTMCLEAVRQDNQKSVKLENLPAPHLMEEYVRHAWFESVAGTPDRKLADALLAQDLAVPDPPPAGWLYKYEHLAWSKIALGCDYHQDGWQTKVSDAMPPLGQKDFLIRY